MESIIRISAQTLGQMDFLWKILAFSFLGLIASEIIFKGFPGLARIAGRPLRSLTRICGLPEEVGSLLLSSLFVSTMATNTVLASWRKSGKINERQMITAAILNSVPAYMRRIIVFLMPVFIPLFGWIFFIGVVFCHLLVITAKIAFCIFYGSGGGTIAPAATSEKVVSLPRGISLKEMPALLKKPLKMFFKISLSLMITTFLVLFFINAGLLEKVAVPVLYPLLKIFGIPQAMSSALIVFSAGNIIVGAGVFQTLLTNGVGIREVFVGVVFGMLISQPAIVLRHVLPNHLAVFGRKSTFRIVGYSLAIVILVRTITFYIFKIALL